MKNARSQPDFPFAASRTRRGHSLLARLPTYFRIFKGIIFDNFGYQKGGNLTETIRLANSAQEQRSLQPLELRHGLEGDSFIAVLSSKAVFL